MSLAPMIRVMSLMRSTYVRTAVAAMMFLLQHHKQEKPNTQFMMTTAHESSQQLCLIFNLRMLENTGVG